MEVQPLKSGILQFRTSQPSMLSKVGEQNYFKKHWQVIYTSIKFFILQRATINIVAFKKSLELLVIHRYTSQIKKNLCILWKQIFGEILSVIQKDQSNPLISLVQSYKTIQDRLSIVFIILKNYLDRQKNNQVDYMNRLGNLIIQSPENVEQEAYDILCRLILSSKQRLQYQKQMILLIEAFRNSSYSQQNVISEETCKKEVQIDLQILKKIGLFQQLQFQFDQKSKQFYVMLSQAIPKNEQYLSIVNEYLERQIQLNKIFQPKINTVYYLEKQLIRDSFDFILNQLLQSIIINKSTHSLCILWNFTLRIKDQAFKNLTFKLKSIIQGVKKYFTQTQNPQDIFKVIDFRQNLINLVERCFDKNRQILNLIYNSFEEVLYEQQKKFLSLALQNILTEDWDEQLKPVIKTQVKQSDSIDIEGDSLNMKTDNFQESIYFKLFRISPSKQNFIKEFQKELSKLMIKKGFEIKTLKMQQKMIQQMKKQVGTNIMKNLDRMLNDVYRMNQMHYYHQVMQNNALMKCMFLSVHWPIQLSLVFNIPDELYYMQKDFQIQFRKSIQNKEKSLKWVSQLGSLYISIHKITSIFTQIETTILFILNKSIRPLKFDQIQSSLNLRNLNKYATNFNEEFYVSQILSNLVKSGILTLNLDSQTYEINDDNRKPYKFTRSYQETCTETIKPADIQKDNSILIEAAIVKIIKRRKTMQRLDLTTLVFEAIKNFRPTFEQIGKCFEKLYNSQYIEINRQKGIISYLE